MLQQSQGHGQGDDVSRHIGMFGIPLEELQRTIGSTGKQGVRFALAASRQMQAATHRFESSGDVADAEHARILGNQVKFALVSPGTRDLLPEFPFDDDVGPFQVLPEYLRSTLLAMPLLSAISDLQHALEMAVEYNTDRTRPASMVDAIDAKLQQWLGHVA